MRRHLDLSIPHLWVVYPRSRDEQVLHLQLVGVWEPSTLTGPSNLTAPLADTLADPEEPETPRDELPEGDDYFSVRGELIYTRPETGDLVVKVRQLPRPDGSKPLPFKLQIKGQIPLEHLRHFVALDLRRHGQELQLEAFEVIAPVVQRGNRGGKKSGRSGSAGGGAGGSGRGASRPGEGRSGGGRGSAGGAGRSNATDSSRVDSSRVERPIKRGDAAARDGAAGGSAAKETEAAGAGVSHRLTGLRNAISRPAR
jgi:hypothetical protein